jgi:DNA-binding transcriptional MerR regulator
LANDEVETAKDALMRISDEAARTGIPISTIRYCEKRAIIPKPNRNGNGRSFSEQDVRATQLVRNAQSLGLKLVGNSTLLQGSWSKGEMAKVASGHRQTVREKIAALNRIDGVLSSLEACRCTSFAECNLNAVQCKSDD